MWEDKLNNSGGTWYWQVPGFADGSKLYELLEDIEIIDCLMDIKQSCVEVIGEGDYASDSGVLELFRVLKLWKFYSITRVLV